MIAGGRQEWHKCSAECGAHWAQGVSSDSRRMSLYRAADLALCGERPEQRRNLFIQRLLGFGTTLWVKAGLRDKLFTNALRQVVHQPEQAVSRHQLGLAGYGAAVLDCHRGDAGLMQM